MSHEHHGETDYPARSRRSRSGQRGGRRAGRGAADGRPGDEAPRDPEELARAICLRLLSDRPRTRAQLATALARRGLPEETVVAVLDRFSEVGLIDDAAFARAWVSSRHRGRGLARGALARELKSRGVAGETVGEALTEVDSETERQTARELVRRRLRTMRGVPAEAAFRRLANLLARKGYPPGVTFQTVRDILAEAEENAEFADAIDVDALAASVEDDPASGNGPDHR